MKDFLFMFSFFVFGLATLGYFGVWEDFYKTAQEVHHYERDNAKLRKKLRFLEIEKRALFAENTKLKAQKEHLMISQVGTVHSGGRGIASVNTNASSKKSQRIKDYVEFDLYQWSDNKLLEVAKKSMYFEKYEKAAQFYQSLLKNYPKSNLISQDVLFQAGVASFESKNHYKWAIKSFSRVVKNYQPSDKTRKAKLWLALSYHKTGQHEKFISSVDDFRLKYRNTSEWKIISKFYEDIAFKYQKREY